MTEEKWLTSVDPDPLLNYIRGRASNRQLRHMMVEFVREITLELVHRKHPNPILAILDLFATGSLHRREIDIEHLPFDKASQIFIMCGWPWRNFDGESVLYNDLVSAVLWEFDFWLKYARVESSRRAISAILAATDENSHVRRRARAMCRAIRDIFGNPFRPVVADPTWLTPTAQSIAAAIYQDRTFDRLPILADALEEAGCTHAVVLLHCRTPGEHVRGCWVVDLVLGKS